MPCACAGLPYTSNIERIPQSTLRSETVHLKVLRRVLMHKKRPPCQYLLAQSLWQILKEGQSQYSCQWHAFAASPDECGSRCGKRWLRVRQLVAVQGHPYNLGTASSLEWYATTTQRISKCMQIITHQNSRPLSLCWRAKAASIALRLNACLHWLFDLDMPVYAFLRLHCPSAVLQLKRLETKKLTVLTEAELRFHQASRMIT